MNSPKIGTAERTGNRLVRGDGTLRKPRTLGRAGCEPVRAIRERARVRLGSGTGTRHEGHIQAGGINKDVRFVEVDVATPFINKLNDAYRTKYRRTPPGIIISTLTPNAHSGPSNRCHVQKARSRSS